MIKKNKSLLIVIFLVILIGFIFKPVRIMNYSNIDKIVITNDAVNRDVSLTLNDKDLTKLKKAFGNYALIAFTRSVGKFVYNLRVDLYKRNKKKYTLYFYSNDSLNNSETPIISLDPQYYTITPDVHETLDEILQDNNFSMRGF